MNTDRALFLMNEFRVKGIRSDLKYTIEFQDIIGTATMPQINEFYKSMNQDCRKLFIWAITCACGYDMAVQIILATVVAEFKYKEIEAIEKQYEEMDRKLQIREATVNKNEAYFRELEAKQKQILDILNK